MFAPRGRGRRLRVALAARLLLALHVLRLAAAAPDVVIDVESLKLHRSESARPSIVSERDGIPVGAPLPRRIISEPPAAVDRAQTDTMHHGRNTGNAPVKLRLKNMERTGCPST